MQENINRKLCETVKESVIKEFQSHKSLIEDSVLSAVRSRAVTPASHIVDQIQIMQVQIMQLVAVGQVNAAFQQVDSLKKVIARNIAPPKMSILCCIFFCRHFPLQI